MSYKIYTDASADVSEELMHDVPAVEMIPMNVELDGVPYLYGPGGNLDNKMFYAAQRSGKFASTSQINPVTYKEYFSRSLEKGEDVIIDVDVTAGDWLKKIKDHIKSRGIEANDENIKQCIESFLKKGEFDEEMKSRILKQL